MAERSDLQKATRTFQVILGGESYTLRVKSILEAVEFRAVLGRLVKGALSVVHESGQLEKSIMQLIEEAKKAAAKAAAEKARKSAGLEPLPVSDDDEDNLLDSLLNMGVASVLPELGTFLIADGLTLLVDAFRAYAPELKEATAKADDEEIVAAAREVLRVNFPLVKKILATVFRVGAVALSPSE